MPTPSAPTNSIQPIELFAQLLIIGLQSFGGGSSTFSLIHQTAIKRGWMSEAEFVRAWTLVQISPGINLVKLTVMIGHQLAGWQGILAAVAGLLLPSAAVTVLMTVGFATVREIPWIQAMMKGVIPAAIGLSFAMGVQMAQPIFASARKDGLPRLGINILVLFAAVLMMSLTKLSPLLILLLSGVLIVILYFLIPSRSLPSSSSE